MKNKLCCSVLLAVFVLSACAADNRLVDRPGKVYIPYANSGISNYLKGNYEQALADYNMAIELNPKHDNAYWKGNPNFRESSRSVWNHTKEISPGRIFFKMLY